MEGQTDSYGEVVDPSALSLPRAAAITRLLVGGAAQGYRFVEARRHASGAETVIVDVHVNRPQRFVHRLRPVEPLALHFFTFDRAPAILSLRADFPDVPHTNPGHRGDPISLCIDDRPWDEARLGWTATDFLVRIQTWLAKTARGELHGDQRAPEPLFVAPGPVIIVDRSIIEAAKIGPTELTVFRPDPRIPREVYVAALPSAGQAQGGLALTALVTDRREMGPLRFPPRFLGELAAEVPEIDLFAYIRTRIGEWVSHAWNGNGKASRKDPERLHWQLGLLVAFPVAKEGNDEIGVVELKLFITEATVAELGVALGCLAKGPDGSHSRLIVPGDPSPAASLPIRCGEVHYGLDRDLAALVSGEPAPDLRRVALIGAGTVGSHVARNLAQEGRFAWDILDRDYLLPHNVPRHVLPASAIGCAKAAALAALLNDLAPGSASFRIADVMLAGMTGGESLRYALEGADLIFDASASVAVSRFLSAVPATPARRVSFFFNAEGSDAVLQVEPADRSATLRELEVQHYAMTAQDPSLSGHLRTPDDVIAYSGACRQATNRMPESRAALLSAAISLEIGAALKDAEGRIVVWQTGNGPVAHKVRPALAWRHLAIGDWRVAVSAEVDQFLSTRRRAALPAETGGVLLGVVDMEARSVHVGLALDPPPDSSGDPAGFERGIAGLRSEIARVAEASAGQLVYVGEWHSHPPASAATPSTKDLLQLAELAELLDMNGVPALMAIVSDEGVRVHCASLVRTDVIPVVVVAEAVR